MPWWGWTVVAACIGFVELHVPGSYIIWIGLGAALTAALTFAWELSITAQLISFIIACAISCFAGFFVYRRVDPQQFSPTTLNQRGLLMVGSRGVVCSGIVNGEGKVRLGDTVWLAEGPDIAEGTSIIVRSVHGSRLVVEAAEPMRSL
jgi:hypothetical protein